MRLKVNLTDLIKKELYFILKESDEKRKRM
jgi:hypothetical protein